MSAVSFVRPQAFAAETFDLLGLSETDGIMYRKGEAFLRDSFSGEAEAIKTGQAITPHKERFIVRRRNNLTGDVMCSFYQVKQKSKGQKRWNYGEVRTVRDVYAEHLFDLRGDIEVSA